MATTVTKTIRASGGDYSLLSSWEAAIPADLVTADEQWIAEIYDDWTNGATVNSLDFAARNTDATRKVVVKAPTGQEYDHATGNGSKISCDGATYQIIVRALDIEFKNIGFHNPSSKTAGVFHKISGANLTVENCYANDIGFDKNSTAGATYNGCGIYLSNYTNYAIYGQIANSCTIVSKGGGAYSGDMIVRDSACTNVAIYNSTTKAVYNTYHNCTGDYNAQNNNGSLAPPGANSISTITTDVFNNYTSNDFHLSSDNTVLAGAGTNLYSDFTTDIDGDTWPSSGAWDIGFDYYVAAGGITGSGTPTATTATTTGSGTVGAAITGSGSPVAETAAVTGVGLRLVSGSGSPTATTATATGSGLRVITGDASPQAETATSTGSGVVGNAIIGSGSPQAETATASGTGLRLITGSGNPQAETATSTGSGTIAGAITGTGTPQAATATASGVGLRVITGSGSPQAQTATAVGTDADNTTIHPGRIYTVEAENRVYTPEAEDRVYVA